jgi:hypothetical protein
MDAVNTRTLGYDDALLMSFRANELVTLPQTFQ